MFPTVSEEATPISAPPPTAAVCGWDMREGLLTIGTAASDERRGLFPDPDDPAVPPATCCGPTLGLLPQDPDEPAL